MEKIELNLLWTLHFDADINMEAWQIMMEEKSNRNLECFWKNIAGTSNAFNCIKEITLELFALTSSLIQFSKCSYLGTYYLLIYTNNYKSIGYVHDLQFFFIKYTSIRYIQLAYTDRREIKEKKYKLQLLHPMMKGYTILKLHASFHLSIFNLHLYMFV